MPATAFVKRKTSGSFSFVPVGLIRKRDEFETIISTCVPAEILEPSTTIIEFRKGVETPQFEPEDPVQCATEFSNT